MAGTIDLELVGDAELAAKLEKLEPDLREALGRRMLEEMIYVSGYIKANKLSGQVLNARSGHLRASVTYDVEEGPGFVEGWAGVPEGPTAKYGWVHEYGGTFQIPQHTRGVPGSKLAGRRYARIERGSIKNPDAFLAKHGYDNLTALAEHATGYATVKAHTATYPERSYIRTSFEELQLRISSRLEEAYEQAVKEGMGE